MATISALKKDLEFNRGLAILIEALKSLAVAQYRILEHKIKTFAGLFKVLEGFFDIIEADAVNHPFFNFAKKKLLIVAVTSDSGLLGGLNMQIINTALKELQAIPGKLVVVGERGKAYASETSVPAAFFPGIVDETRYEQAVQLRDYLVRTFTLEAFDTLKIVYPHPVSFTIQKVETIACLPFVQVSAGGAAQKKPPLEDIVFESKIEDILEYLVYIWVGQKLYDVFGLSRLAEFAARYVHLEDSLQKLKKLDIKKQQEYFRVRHEIVDRSMRELFAARAIYAS